MTTRNQANPAKVPDFFASSAALTARPSSFLPRPLLAVVIIARNEAQNISRTTRAVVDGTAFYPACHVVLVDSCSIDATVDIAKAFSITIAVVNQNITTTAALGRRVGQLLTNSTYILFVDGDTEIDRAFVPQAIKYLEANPRVAGVAGKLKELHYASGKLVRTVPNHFSTAPHPEEVYQLGGNAIYRREALEEVGSFNIEMFSYEEAELAERLRHAGFVIVRLPIEMGTHHTGSVGSHTELLRRMRDRLMIGHGQLLRVSMRQGCLRSHFSEIKRFVQSALLSGLGVVAASASVLRDDARLFLGWAASCLVLFLALAIRTKSVRRALLLIAEWTYALPFLLFGFARGARHRSQLNLHRLVRVVQVASFTTVGCGADRNNQETPLSSVSHSAEGS